MPARKTKPTQTAFITGFPLLTVRTLAEQLLAASASTRVYLLVDERDEAAARQFVESLPPRLAKRLRYFTGNCLDMDLGLSGPECNVLIEEVDHVYHLAQVSNTASRELLHRINVHGTRNLLNFVEQFESLRRVVHWSTALVAGDRTGVILEEELEEGQRFRNYYEESKCVAEREARRAMDRLPVTVVRPGVLIGHSESGEIDRTSGPYFLLLAVLSFPLDLPLARLKMAGSPFHLVCVNHAAECAWRLALAQEAEGRVFHVTDCNPYSVRRVVSLIAEAGRRQPLARNLTTQELTQSVSSLAPGLARSLLTPRHALDTLMSLASMVTYNNRGLIEVLGQRALFLPPLDDCVEKVVTWVTQTLMAEEREAQAEFDVEDQLD